MPVAMPRNLRRQDFRAMEYKAADAAELLGTMANPTRLLMLCQMVEGEKSVGELVAQASLSQGAVSQHLAKMRAQGLVATRRQAQTIYYRLASAEAVKLLQTLYGIYCART